MSTLIEVFIISAFCCGLHQAAQPGMILEKLMELGSKLPTWIFYPLIGCPYCMASLWGSIVYWSLELSYNDHVIWQDFLRWPIVCVACVFLNGYLHESLESLQKKNQ